jgi:hypothetical protein
MYELPRESLNDISGSMRSELLEEMFTYMGFVSSVGATVGFLIGLPEAIDQKSPLPVLKKTTIAAGQGAFFGVVLWAYLRNC